MSLFSKKQDKLSAVSDFDVSIISQSRHLPSSSLYESRLSSWLDQVKIVHGKNPSPSLLDLLENNVNAIYTSLEGLFRPRHTSEQTLRNTIVESHTWIITVNLISSKKYFKKIMSIVKPSPRLVDATIKRQFNKTLRYQIDIHRQVINKLSANIDTKKEYQLSTLQVAIIEAKLKALISSYHETHDAKVWSELNSLYGSWSKTSSNRGKTNISTEAIGVKTSTSTPTMGRLSDAIKNQGIEKEVTADAVLAFQQMTISHTIDFADGKVKNAFQTQLSATALKATGKIGFKAKAGGGSASQAFDPGKGEKLGAGAGVKTDAKYTNKSEEELDKDDEFDEVALIPGLAIGLNVEAAIESGLKIEIKNTLNICDILNFDTEASLFAGAEVKFTGAISPVHGHIKGGKAGLKFEAAAFAGIKGSIKGTAGLNARGIPILSITGKATGTLGAGAKAGLELTKSYAGTYKFKLEACATAGFGAEVETETAVNFVGASMLIWDKFSRNFNI